MSRHFLLTTMFSGGDVVPFVRLGAQLRSLGHRVTLVTHAPYREQAASVGLEFDAWDTGDEHAEMMGDGTLFNEVSGFATIYERYVLPKLEREREVLRAHCTADTVIVTRCGPALAARAVAEERGAALVEAYLGPGHVSPPAIVREFVQPFQSAIARLRGREDKEGDDDTGAWTTANNAAVGLWPAWFAPPEPHWPSELALTDFIAAPRATGALDPELARFLHGEERVVLLATGTGLFVTKAVVEACIAAAAELGLKLLLVTPFDELVPSIPQGAYRVRSAPYDVVVPRMSLVLHHGGIGTVQDGLRAGVPQIALGTGGDRPINAASLVRLGVGAYVRPAEWSKAAILDAMKTLLGSETVRHACEATAARMRSDPGDGAARHVAALPRCSFAEAVERVRRDRGAVNPAPRAMAARAGERSVSAAQLASLSPAQRALLIQRARKKVT